MSRYLEQALNVTKRINPDLIVAHTGHSLGGFIAQIMTVISSSDSNVSAVTFDTPGISKCLDDENFRQRYNLTEDRIKRKKIVTYNTAPHLINTLHSQFYEVVRLYPEYGNKLDNYAETAQCFCSVLNWLHEYGDSNYFLTKFNSNWWWLVNIGLTLIESMHFLYKFRARNLSQNREIDGVLILANIMAFYHNFRVACIKFNGIPHWVIDKCKEIPDHIKHAGFTIDQHSIVKIIEEFNPETKKPRKLSNDFHKEHAYSLSTLKTKEDFYHNYDINPYYWEREWKKQKLSFKDKMFEVISKRSNSTEVIYKRGVTILGDDSGNWIWGSTNYGDVINTGDGDDIIWLFSGDDNVTDIGGNDQYRFYIYNMRGIHTINDTGGVGEIYFEDINCAIKDLVQESNDTGLFYFSILDNPKCEVQNVRNSEHRFYLRKVKEEHLIIARDYDPLKLMKIKREIHIENYSEGVLGIYLNKAKEQYIFEDQYSHNKFDSIRKAIVPFSFNGFMRFIFLESLSIGLAVPIARFFLTANIRANFLLPGIEIILSQGIVLGASVGRIIYYFYPGEPSLLILGRNLYYERTIGSWLSLKHFFYNFIKEKDKYIYGDATDNDNLFCAMDSTSKVYGYSGMNVYTFFLDNQYDCYLMGDEDNIDSNIFKAEYYNYDICSNFSLGKVEIYNFKDTDVLDLSVLNIDQVSDFRQQDNLHLHLPRDQEIIIHYVECVIVKFDQIDIQKCGKKVIHTLNVDDEAKQLGFISDTYSSNVFRLQGTLVSNDYLFNENQCKITLPTITIYGFKQYEDSLDLSCVEPLRDYTNITNVYHEMLSYKRTNDFEHLTLINGQEILFSPSIGEIEIILNGNSMLIYPE